VSAGERN